ASFQRVKNPSGVVNALAMLNKFERSKIHIQWYGQIEVANFGSALFEEALDIIKSNNLEDVLELYPPTKDISDIMHSADFVALFSELGGMPTSICEAMMLGKPIIMTRVSDYSRLIDDSNGFLCEWDNLGSIKNTFITAIG